MRTRLRATQTLRPAAASLPQQRARRTVGLAAVALLALAGVAIPAAAQAAPQAVSTIAVGTNPVAIALAPDGTIYTADARGNSLTQITDPDTAQQTVTTIPVGASPTAVAVAADGTVYTTIGADNTLLRITDPATSQQRTTAIPVGRYPVGIAVATDGTVYTANSSDGTVTRVAAAGTAAQTLTTIPVGLQPSAVTVAPDGTLYTANRNSGSPFTVSRILDPGSSAPRTTTLRPRVPSPTSTMSIVASPDGTVVASSGVTTLRISDPTSAQPVFTSIRTGNLQPSLSIGPDGALYAFAQFRGYITKITDAGTDHSVTYRTQISASPYAGVVGPDGTIFTANYDQSTVSVVVSPAFVVVSPVFTAAAPPSGTVGSPYSYTFTTAPSAPGVSVPTFAVATGDVLPAGLTLSTSGVLSGTPTTAGPTTFRIVAGSSGGTTTTAPLTVTIDPTPVPPVFTAADPTATGTVGAAYSYTFAATGIPAPTFTVAPGSTLPDGLTLDAPSGLLSGTPTTEGTSTFRVVAANGAGSAVTDPLTLTVAPAPIVPLTTPTITSPRSGQQVTDPVTVTGTGTPGDLIALITYPTGIPPQSSQLVDDAFADPAPTQVGTDGTWSVRRTVAAGPTTVFAVAFTRDASGAVTNTSAVSPRVTFTVLAASGTAGSVPTASASPTAPAVVAAPGPRPDSGTLAFTGADLEPLLITGAAAAILIAAGASTLATRRRRRLT